MLTIHVWPKQLKEFLLTHPLYKSPSMENLPGVYPFFTNAQSRSECKNDLHYESAQRHRGNRKFELRGGQREHCAKNHRTDLQ
jgi:hypothetical protein